ncbi:type I-E CRISPR-associated protein Cse1/CasA [Nostocoides jenkinsii]|uniref:CRISPR-associated protein, Cse1 family n=1 Tax=Nostocoides jenkinsii Ben 74 TaxID=1193518 RepID=A0A077MGY2_9MICO|nr:type I-E CRISPR-associated protein Cse1/CasA [Tetrasphaera jenkinsii]CCI54962.1 conserved hypothetical protein [Tetrasphaera jenkinsii Ben 74]
MTGTTSFDLRTHPWIAVRTDGGVEEVSLLDLFRRAGEIRAIAGEIPTQDVALLRLLLVILHRSLPESFDYPHQRWASLWRAPTLPVDDIEAYLDQWADRFDLLHPQTPFLQVAGLSAAKTSGLVKLIAEVPAGNAYFTTRAGRAVESLSYAEAARWLVHSQQFDVSGIKTGAFGDDRVKGGRGYPIGTGLAGRLGLIILEGESLRETLLLNLVLRIEEDYDADRPVWERAPLGPGLEVTHPVPGGPADLMTWPIRRILLQHNGSEVTDVLIANGDPIHARNLHNLEMMSAWRRSANQEKTYGEPTYMPRQHDPARKLWRGLDGVLARPVAGGSVRGEAATALPAGAVLWLNVLTERESLPPDVPIRIHAVGMSYGTQDSMIESIYDDALSVRPSVLLSDRLAGIALAAAEEGEVGVRQLAQFAANLAAAAGREVEGPREKARLTGFARLDGRYAAWLAGLESTTDVAAAQAEWRRTVATEMTAAGNELLRTVGADALIGRKVNGKHLDAALSDLWFRAFLRKNFIALANQYTERTGAEHG